MEDRLVIIDADSIGPAQLVARDHPDLGTWVFDPTLFDKAIDAGLPNVVLVAPRPATDHPTLLGWARDQAFALEADLDRMLQTIAPTASILGWQHQNLQYQITASRWYAELWDDQRALFEGTCPHLFLCDNPAHYYWPSFGPGLLLAHRLRGAGIDFKAYAFGARADLSRLVPRLFDEPGGSEHFDLLTHLPTAFYDKGYYLDEVRASRHRTINLQSRIWNVDFAVDADVPVANADEARSLLDAAKLDRIDTFHEVSAQHLEGWLAVRIPSPEHRRRQALHIAEGYRSQLITLALLERRFARRRPCRILITDHDAGFHGPILSFALSHGIPVVMVPHSKTTSDLDFPGRHITCLTHPMQADAMSDAMGLRVRHHSLALPEAFSADSAPAGEIRTVGLMLNGLAINGVQFTQFDSFVEGIRRIGDWCRARGLPLKVRSRPGQVMTTLIAEASGLDPRDILSAMTESVADFARSVDICLMYDAPTSAGLEFVKNGIAILNPVPEPLFKAEAIAANTSVIPRDSVDAMLARLDDLVTDPVRFSDFRRQQFIAYVRLFAQAHPLRDFLETTIMTTPSRSFAIAGRPIGPAEPPYCIAEVGINHNGDVELAMRMIDAAREAGADAVKFQTFRAEEFCGDPEQTFTYRSQGVAVTESMLAMFRRYEFAPAQWREIDAHCRKVGITFFSTPQNRSDLDLLLTLDVPAVKVGSDDFTNLPLLRDYAQTGLPLILSCGMADLAEVHRSLETAGWFDGAAVALLLCTSQYPTPPSDVNITKLATLRQAFPGLLLGFSDHTQGAIAATLAVALGARIFEKHFTMNRDLPGPDHWFSEDPAGIAAWIAAIRQADAMLGSPFVRPTAAEREMRTLARRSVVALCDVAGGDTLTVANVGLRRPGNGLPPEMLEPLLGMTATHGIRRGATVALKDLRG